MPRSAKENNRISLPLEWPYRLLGNLVILGIIFFLASITVTIKTDLINKKLLNLQDSFYRFTTDLGFTVEDIIVSGRRHTGMDEIRSALNIDRRTNILRLNLDEIRERLEQLPWIRKVVVRRSFFPHTLYIGILEYTVKSLWQYNGKFHPIGENGQIINADYIPRRPVLLIVGAGAPENISKLLPVIEKDKDIFRRVKVAVYVSGRRWNLILDHISHGIVIKLPETGVRETWEKLIKLNRSKNILKRKLTNIDLRLKGKVIVKLEKSDSAAAKKRKAKESKI